MKKNLILSLVTAAVMPLSLVSCSNNAEISVEENSKVSETTEITENVSEDITEENTESTEQTEEVSEEQTEIQENTEEESDYEEDSEFERVSLDEVNEMAKKLLEDVKISDNKKAVQEDIDKLLEYEDKASDLVAYSAIDFNYDWQNEAISEKDDILNEDLVVIDAGLTYAFCNAALSEEYAELFKDLIFDDPESNEVYTVRGNSLRRTEEYARVDFRLSDETLDEYYEILYDENMTDDEKDIKCAELYIDILSGYDPETFYDFYYRDFTPEEATETTELILKELVPAYNELVQKYIELDENDELGNIEGVKEPFKVIQKYAPQLSDSIKESIDMLIDENLYCIGDETKSMDTGFTLAVPTTHKALIYNMTYGNYRDLTDCVHEFGHFYSICKDRTPAYLQINNSDVAEIQSQALEIIFTRFYDDIYGEYANLAKAAVTTELLDTVIESFLIGEFEYEMVQNIESMTPQDVIDKFNEIVHDKEPDARFYWIQHLFQQPGYYVSYGVSALAAFNIFDENIDAPEKAVEKYEKIAEISAISPDCRFKETLEKCGFDDIFTEKYIKNLAKAIKEYAESLK
ncbi:MAG: hypothetical protein IKS03_08720 [Ruminococcus sp.]|nr:hypothetical protein [Ruminococcus sp.]